MSLYLKVTPTLQRTIKQVLSTSKDLTKTERFALKDAIAPESHGASLDALAVLDRMQDVGTLKSLLQGSSMCIPSLDSQVSTKKLDPEQEKRKKRLKERVQERELHRMVSNVDSRQKMARQFKAGAAVSLKSASFGLHIILGMVFGFVAGYLLARTAYGGGQTVQVIGGIIGMVGTLIMEVTLYIIRDEKARLEAENRARKILEGKKEI